MDTGSTDGTVIDSGLPEKPPEKEGTRGPVGSRELGKVVCSTGNLQCQQESTKGEASFGASHSKASLALNRVRCLWDHTAGRCINIETGH